ncbi:ABC transporter substrate-binding protein [Cronobacter sakazakii]|nr:ABC transporter substrate-binding protein [Cronobacter sakazakii]
MKKLTFTFLTVALAGASSLAFADTLRMECPVSPGGKQYCQYIKERFEKQTGNQLEFIEFPAASDEKLALLQQLFAAKDEKAVDVFQSDTIWIGLLDKQTLDLTDAMGGMEKDFFPGPWKNNTVNGRLKAVPSYIDTGVLFYRKDLLEKYKEQPPKTWDEMTRIATKIQAEERKAGHKNFWGYIFQGKSYEGLTCNALEWIDSYGGGTFVDEKGNVTINNPKAAQALDMVRGWMGKITPKGVLGYKEEESRTVFQNGDALFMRNWPYVWQLSQADDSPLKGKVGVIQLPAGPEGRQATTLGGWQWSINANTKNPEAAIALLKILSDDDSQIIRLKMLGHAPTRVALYENKDVLAVAPELTQFRDIFAQAVPRPATVTKAQYPRVSNAIFNVTFSVLNGKEDGKKATEDLQKRLTRAKGAGWR